MTAPDTPAQQPQPDPAREAMQQVCSDIQEIMRVYREQIDSYAGLGTPGGLEHMNDVWQCLHEWDDLLTNSQVPAVTLTADRDTREAFHNDRYKRLHDEFQLQCARADQVEADRDTLRAENARLREVVRRFQQSGCPDCSGDCGSANPPVACCIMQEARAALAAPSGERA